MVTLNEYVKGKDFGGDTDPLPEGETIIDTTTIEVKEVERDYPDGKKKRFELTVGDKVYEVGVKVMNGIKKAVEEKGATKVKVIRQGKDKQTSYVVLPYEKGK